MYSCMFLFVFSAYTCYTESQLYSDQTYTVTETMLSITQCESIDDYPHLSVNAFKAKLVSLFQFLIVRLLMRIIQSSFNYIDSSTSSLPHKTLTLFPNQSFVNRAPEVWTAGFSESQSSGFDLTWTGNYSLFMWATAANGFSFMNSSQVNLTSPLILAPFKSYTILLSMTKYVLGSLSFLSYVPGWCLNFCRSSHHH